MDSPAPLPPPSDPPDRVRSRSRQAGPPFPTGPLAPLAHALLLGGATAAVFLAGKPQEGALGVFLLCAGLAMTICPPRVRLGRPLWILAAVLVGCGALALLPEHFLPQPAWRQALDTAPPITMAHTVSTAPALTRFWLAVLAISVLTGLFMLTQPIRSRGLFVFALAAALAVGVYAALAIYAHDTGWRYPFSGDASFGFFPNRNHTATFLCAGSLLALGVLGVTLREGRWFVSLLAAGVMAVCVAGLMFYLSSRGGIVFLVAGVGLWMAGLGSQHRDRRLVVSFTAVLIAGGLLFLLGGGESRDRLLGKKPATLTPAAITSATAPDAPANEDAAHNLTTELRTKIYRDTLGAVRDFPLTGLGLGTFALVFPQYRQASLSDSAAAHPESDWLMFVAETGIPALGCLLALAGLAAGRLRFERGHPYWPLRWGCAVAAAAALLHGTVDVPWHRVQLGWWLLVVAGLALQSARAGVVKSSRGQHAVFIVGGLAALTLGATLVRAQWFGGPPLPPFVAEKAQADIFEAFNRQDINGATILARQAVRASPMVAPLYYQLGALLLRDDDNDAEVDRVFAAQRLLDPVWVTVPLQQGDAWLSIDPGRTAGHWLEAWTLREKIDRAMGAPPGVGLDFYRQLFHRAEPFPAARHPLDRLATRSPAYALAWLQGTDRGVTAEDWGRLTASPEFLRDFSETERQQFLLLWYTNAGMDAVTRFVGEHPDWQAAAWRVRLREWTDKRQFETAVHEAAAHDQVPLELRLRPAPPAGTADPDPASENPLDAFARYWRGDNHITARRILQEAVQTAGAPPMSPEYWQTRLAVAVQDQDWKAAWEAMQNYLRLTHPAESLP